MIRRRVRKKDVNVKLMGWSQNIFKNWSEPVRHKIGDTLLDGGSGKEYKQIGHILRSSDIPESSGIYLFRDWRDDRNIYCGKTEGQTLRKRLAQHLTGQSGKLRKGEEYVIRWFAEGSSWFGNNTGLLEAVAIIYLNPEYNPGNDWKKYLKREDPKKVLDQAKSLGFYPNDRDEREVFCLKIIEYICQGI